MPTCPDGMNAKVSQLIQQSLSPSETKEITDHINNCNLCDFKLTKTWRITWEKSPPVIQKHLLAMISRHGANENSRGMDILNAIIAERNSARDALKDRGIELPDSLEEFVDMMKAKGIPVQVHELPMGNEPMAAMAEIQLPRTSDIGDVIGKLLGSMANRGIPFEQIRNVKNVNGVEIVDLAHQFQVNNFMGEAPKCPTCNRALGGVLASDGTPVRPKAGDTTICIYCEIPLKFTKTMDLKAITPEEQEEWPAFFRQKINHSLQMLKQYKANRPMA